MKLDGRSALVTGGASGLGLATVKRLHEGGASVVIADLNAEAGQAVVTELGERARFVRTDVTDEDQVRSAVQAATELGNFSVAVNCAGITLQARVVGREGPFPLDVFQKVVNINLVGTFNVIRLAAEPMVASPTEEEERGVIVNTASVAAFDGQIGQAAYAASKGGIVGMTLPIARDLAKFKIRVATVAPGIFYTPLFEGLGEEVVSSLGQQVPNPARMGDPAEFASLVAHIVDNPYLNGEVIRLDGAIRMAPR